MRWFQTALMWFTKSFDTVTVDFGNKEKADCVCRCLESSNLRRVNDTQVALHSTKHRHAKIWLICTALVSHSDTSAFADDVKGRLNAELLRQDDILQHPVFNRYHTEHEMLRYLEKTRRPRLGDEPQHDLLGSCNHETQRDCGNVAAIRN